MTDRSLWLRNAAVLRHEAETPMRGHDPDGACCRRAVEDAVVRTTEVVTSPYIPEGTMILAPRGLVPLISDIDFAPNPWPEPSILLGEHAARERDRALAFLAARIDDVYEQWGMDPVEKWRRPKIAAEHQRRNRIRYAAEAHFAFSVRPSAAIVISTV